MPDVPESLAIETIRTPGLGDATYVAVYDGIGIVVDPQRDVDRFLAAVDNHGAEPRWVLETHVHNDYVSGGLTAATSTGAQLVMPAGSAPTYRHTPAFHNEPFSHGDLSVVPLHTPGHTPEHVSYVLEIDGTPVAVFSGGSLLVGSAGRSDLLGVSRAETLARLQYGSVKRLAKLPDDTGLYPTHGAGSFCAVTGGTSVTSTIGAERVSNPVLQYADADTFVSEQLSALQPYPSYYRHMGSINLEGGDPIQSDAVPPMSIEEAADAHGSATFVDMRSRDRFAAGHIPGALGIEHEDAFGTWVGWLVDIDTPIVLVADSDQAVDDAITQLARIGYDSVIGVLTEMDRWETNGNPIATTPTVDVATSRDEIADGRPVLDVRAPDEWEDGHIDDSTHVYVPDIPTASTDALEADNPIVVCGSGFRAMIAASLLERRGVPATVLARGGVSDLLA